MRIPFSAMQGSLDAINVAATQFAKAQQQVASSKRVVLPSDDPAAAQRAVLDQAEISTLDAYTRASDTASSRLSVLDSVLGAVVDKLIAATTTATGARGATATPALRAAAAESLIGVRDALLGDLNTQFRGTFLFAGTMSQTQPYALVAGAWTYQGNTTPVSSDVGRNSAVQIGLDGSAIAQGADSTNLFTEFDKLITAVQTGDAVGLGTGIDALTRAFNRTIRAQSDVGADEATISAGQEQLGVLRLAGVARLSKDVDANMAEAITKMNNAQTAYQAALAAVGKANRNSLLDYI